MTKETPIRERIKEAIWEHFRPMHTGATNDSIASIQALIVQAKEEGARAYHDALYEKINGYIGSPNNPDYEMPSSSQLLEMMDETLSNLPLE